MSKRRLKGIKSVAQDVKDILKRQDIETCGDLLSRNTLELMNFTNLDFYRIKDIHISISKEIAPKPTRLKDIFDKGKGGKVLATSLNPLDQCLKGGLPVAGITEVTGPPGVGKTQLCLTLTAVASCPESKGGDDAGVIYIDTEGAFTAIRFLEILHSKLGCGNSDDPTVRLVASKVAVYPESTCDGLKKRLFQLEEEIVHQNTKLLIVDSIASLIRKEYSSDHEYNERNNVLLELASNLKYLAENFQLAVLVTNQITTRQKERIHAGVAVRESFITAALGNTWAHAVNTRLVLQFRDSNVREMLVAKSPCSPCRCFAYEVLKSGVHMAEEGDRGEQIVREECSSMNIRTKTYNNTVLQ